MLPLADLPPEWTLAKSGDRHLETFNADNLYEKIDGRAESFLQYGVKGMAYTFYHPTGDTSNELQLYIFEMADGLKQVPDAHDRYNFEHYWLDHWDAHRIKLLMDSAAAWGKTNGVPLICNEFGVYRHVTPEASRMQWIRDVRTALEADGIGWTMWDYRGGFGVVWKEDDGQPARVDQKVVDALGLKK